MIYHKLPRKRDTRGLVRLGLYASIFLILVAVAYRIKQYTPMSSSPNTPTPDQVLLHVGSENIYYKDLFTELARYPNPNDESAKGILTQKLITDSVILQGGQEDGLVELDQSFFNSLEKDYTKRIEMVEHVKSVLNNDSMSTKGYVVAIWFRNNGYVGPRGLDASKDLARKKLDALHTEVAAGRMSVQKAGDIIMNDSSLKELDLAYKNNAIFPFTLYSGDTKRVTLNQDLDEELADLPQGGVSKLYLGKGEDPQTGVSYDALYLFGQVTEKQHTTKTYMSFDDWLQSKKGTYEVGS